MANVAHKKRGAKIGLKGLVFALLLTDTSAGATYETELHEVPGAIEAGITVQISDEVLGADDNPVFDQFAALDSVDVNLTLAAIGPDVEAFLLGRKKDSKGVMLSSSADSAPYVAMGYKTLRTDGSYDYMWLYKGKFKPGDDTSRTRERGTVNFQTPSIVATFGPRDFDDNIYARVNDKDEELDSGVIATFLDAPYAPSAGSGG